MAQRHKGRAVSGALLFGLVLLCSDVVAGVGAEAEAAALKIAIANAQQARGSVTNVDTIERSPKIASSFEHLTAIGGARLYFDREPIWVNEDIIRDVVSENDEAKAHWLRHAWSYNASVLEYFISTFSAPNTVFLQSFACLNALLAVSEGDGFKPYVMSDGLADVLYLKIELESGPALFPNKIADLNPLNYKPSPILLAEKLTIEFICRLGCLDSLFRSNSGGGGGNSGYRSRNGSNDAGVEPIPAKFNLLFGHLNSVLSGLCTTRLRTRVIFVSISGAITGFLMLFGFFRLILGKSPVARLGGGIITIVSIGGMVAMHPVARAFSECVSR